MAEGIELDLTAKEIAELEDFLHLGIQMGSGMGKNTGVLRKLMYGLIKRIPENHGLKLSSEKPSIEPTAYLVYVKNEVTPQEGI